MITENIIKEIYPVHGLKYFNRIDIIQYFLRKYDIDTPLRMAHFFSQIGHECGEFRYRVELRSDASAEVAYGFKTNVGKVLGNDREGDGGRFKGRGFPQLTGRYNYQLYSNYTGIDFVKNPELLEDDIWAFHSAVWYWDYRGLNTWADKDDAREVTKRINGGYNGWEDRMRYLDRAKKAFKI